MKKIVMGVALCMSSLTIAMQQGTQEEITVNFNKKFEFLKEQEQASKKNKKEDDQTKTKGNLRVDEEKGGWEKKNIKALAQLLAPTIMSARSQAAAQKDLQNRNVHRPPGPPPPPGSDMHAAPPARPGGVVQIVDNSAVLNRLKTELKDDFKKVSDDMKAQIIEIKEALKQGKETTVPEKAPAAQTYHFLPVSKDVLIKLGAVSAGSVVGGCILYKFCLSFRTACNTVGTKIKTGYQKTLEYGKNNPWVVFLGGALTAGALWSTFKYIQNNKLLSE